MMENGAAINLSLPERPSKAQGGVAEHVLLNQGRAIVGGGFAARILPGGFLL